MYLQSHMARSVEEFPPLSSLQWTKNKSILKRVQTSNLSCWSCSNSEWADNRGRGGQKEIERTWKDGIRWYQLHRCRMETAHVDPPLTLKSASQHYADRLWTVNPALCCVICLFSLPASQVCPLNGLLGRWRLKSGGLFAFTAIWTQVQR